VPRRFSSQAVILRVLSLLNNSMLHSCLRRGVIFNLRREGERERERESGYLLNSTRSRGHFANTASVRFQDGKWVGRVLSAIQSARYTRDFSRTMREADAERCASAELIRLRSLIRSPLKNSSSTKAQGDPRISSAAGAVIKPADSARKRIPHGRKFSRCELEREPRAAK